MEDGPPSITPALGVGLHDISDSIYHGDCCAEPSLSSSLSKVLVSESCKHAYYSHPRLGGRARPKKEPTSGMEFGTLIHALLLAEGKGIAVGDFNSWQSNDAKAFKIAARNSGVLPVLQKTLAEAKELCCEFHNEINRLGYAAPFAAARKEVAGIWNDGPIWLRSKYDALLVDEAAGTVDIFDLKISTAANPSAVEAQIGKMDWDLQHEFYKEGIANIMPHMAGRIRFTFFVIEDEFPFSLVPVVLSGEAQALGRMKFERAKKLWSLCRSTGEWPGYVSAPFRASPKPWDLSREAEDAIPEFSVK